MWYRRHCLSSLTALALVVVGCNDPEAPPEEQELITRVVVTLTPVGGGAAQSAEITDPDGLGPQAPSAPSAVFQLATGVSYNGAVTFEDASDPANIVDITEEVEAEGDLHRVFYTIAGLTGVTIPGNSLDTDGNGAPLGLTFQVVVTAQASGTGTIRVVLSHYDAEPKGDGSTPSDETDVDVTFNATVP